MHQQLYQQIRMPSYRTVAEVLSGVLQDFRPDLVLYDAGVDPHADDKLGRLKLTDSGLMRREMQVSMIWHCSSLHATICSGLRQFP